jgi:hypothetical protein
MTMNKDALDGDELARERWFWGTRWRRATD